MANAITYAMAYTEVLNKCEGIISTEAYEKISKALERESNKTRKVDEKKLAENNGIKDSIVATLGTVDRATVTELQKMSSELGELSNQKISSLLSQLVKDNKVVKTIEKKVSYFSIA